MKTLLLVLLVVLVLGGSAPAGECQYKYPQLSYYPCA